MDILGYDCDGQEIYEYRILVGIWVGDVDIRDLPDTDPRIYCALVGDDGNAYAISVYDYGNDDMDFRAKLIREREHIPDGEPIPTIIKPIEEMENYEVAFHWDGSQGMNIWEYEGRIKKTTK